MYCCFNVSTVEYLVEISTYDKVINEPSRQWNLGWMCECSSLEFVHFSCHGGREELCPSLLWHSSENLINFFFKVHIQQLVSFIQNQMLDSAQTEPLSDAKFNS